MPHRLAPRVLCFAVAALFAVVLASHVRADARPREFMDAAQLGLAIRKLGVLESVLYIAAHPDDENTALLAYLSRERLARVGYLSLTRGDGGQNLLGTETGEALGVIRTQELLAARRVDGAEQFFTRALDFGFSKNPEETLAIWGRDSVLADMVWVIRRFRPDILITRFPTDGSGGHGHHTASAILAEEAFTAAADPARFPEQLARGVTPWQARRILWNAWRPDTTRGAKMLRLDLGRYSAPLGRSCTEIAAESRSMHKSQGFGSAERRGSIESWYVLRGGAPADSDVFDGVVADWRRVPGAAGVASQLAAAARAFDPAHPAAILPMLGRAHRELARLGDDPWASIKRTELEDVMRACAGLWLEAVAQSPSASPGGTVKVTALALNRSSAPLVLERVAMPFGALAVAPVPPAPFSGGFGGTSAVAKQGAPGSEVREQPLPDNRAATAEAVIHLPADLATTQPYWLRSPSGKGLFRVSNRDLIGSPENPPALTVRLTVRIAGESIPYDVPVVYRFTDPVIGERYRPFEIVPPVSLRLDQGVYLFPDGAPREVRLTVECGDEPLSGVARLGLPEGWKCEPAVAPLALQGKGDETTLRFTVTPGAGPAAATLSAWVESAGARYANRRVTIDYPHIPVETLLPPAEAHLVRVDLRKVGDEVGYVAGSGDQIPEALRQMGWRVTTLSDDDLGDGVLSRFSSIVVGVRAYNTRPRLRALQVRLLEYVRSGGTLVLQYDTADDALKDRLGPWPFTISRDRVTVEEAPIRLLKPDHPLLTRPNRITASDFEGWVQERGLYFPNPYDPKYETVISCNDPHEPARDGGILYAHYGNGVFIYTGYSWFRQLPAGVPGAYRLFANLVSARP
jgi:LmbE family N-acetylglucosaminyl deacetylase